MGAGVRESGGCHMPGDPNECRKHAKECLHRAISSRSSYACEHFEELAKMWIRLAVEIERTEQQLAAVPVGIKAHRAAR
jgi:hypothetical protein